MKGKIPKMETIARFVNGFKDGMFARELTKAGDFPGDAQVYALLYRLEKAGFLRSEKTGRIRKYYYSSPSDESLLLRVERVYSRLKETAFSESEENDEGEDMKCAHCGRELVYGENQRWLCPSCDVPVGERRPKP